MIKGYVTATSIRRTKPTVAEGIKPHCYERAVDGAEEPTAMSSALSSGLSHEYQVIEIGRVVACGLSDEKLC